MMSTGSHTLRAFGQFPVQRVLVGLLGLGVFGCAYDDRRVETAQVSAPAMSLVPPAYPAFLVPPMQRAVGPLQAIPEGQVQIERKLIPSRLQMVETFSADSDMFFRVQSAQWVRDARTADHRDSTRRLQGLGITPDGLLRFRVDYPRSGSITLEHGRPVAKADPVEGKVYVIDIGARGMRVLTHEGLTPSASEVAMIQEDHEALKIRPEEENKDAPLRKRNVAQPVTTEQTPTEYVREQILRGMKRNGVTIDAFGVNFQGVRQIDGMPCAVFQVGFTTRKQVTNLEQTSWVKTSLGGEYAIRLSDGWDAEVLLTGWTTKTIQRLHEGIPVTISTAASLRLYWRTLYMMPEPEADRTLEKLDR